MAEEMNVATEGGAEGAEATVDEGVATQAEDAKATEEAQESGAAFSDGEASEEAEDGAGHDDGEGDAKDGTKTEQSAGERAINAFRRREEERRAELKRVREEAIMEALGGINPFTGEDMKDSEDVAQYLEMREIKTRGGDPVGEYAKYHKIMEKERAQKEADEAAKQAAEEERLAARERDAQAFRDKHPGVTVQTMMNDADFVAYAKGRVGKDTSVFAVYDAYASAKAAEEARVEQRAREIAAQQAANAGASPGTAVGEVGNPPDVFTVEQIKGMSREEVKENYDKICKSLDYWK